MRITITEEEAQLVRNRQLVVRSVEQRMQGLAEQAAIANGALIDVVTSLAWKGGASRDIAIGENCSIGYEGNQPILTIEEKPRPTTGDAG